jgi:uncharacterized protein (DUF1697 family)
MAETPQNTYIAILRGINVSGKNMIKMPALIKTFESLGYNKIKTYVQSGNVIFQTKPSKSKDLEKQIHDRIDKDFDTRIPVMVLNNKYISEIQENNPFLDRKETDLTKLHVTFLSEAPEKENTDKINTAQYAPDEFIIDKKVIYLYCPGGYGKTKLNNNFFENKLKVTATTRNWNTVNKLVELIK